MTKFKLFPIRSTVEMRYTQREWDRVQEMMQEMDISEAGVLKQALRIFDNIRSGAWTINYPPDDGKFPCGLLGDDE